MATLGDINTKITNLLGVDTNTFANASRLIDLNLWYQKIVSMILDAQDETDFDDANKTDYPRYTFPLTVNRDYSISQTYGTLKIKSLSVTYDGVNYYRATPVDSTQFAFADAPAAASAANANIDANFVTTSPAYDYKYGSLWLYPRATTAQVNSGAQALVEFFRAPTEFTLSDLTTGTLVPGFDQSFHMMLAYGAAFEYAQANQHPSASSIYRELQTYEERLRRQYSSKQLDRHYALYSAYECYK